jgi:ABC-type transport system involved in multi-copper enzyme maturation permease subunit
LLIAATMALILWGYQKIYYQKTSLLLLILAIVLAALAFGLAIFHIVTIWRKSKKGD